jgi:4-amino-4-deoxy-L-arabinose transferase-like glycosyltransferase
MPALGRERILAILPVLSILLLLLCVFGRIAHPAELEWMEGAMLDASARLSSDIPLYGEPSLARSNFVYPPLHYALTWCSGQLFGDSFLSLRIPSLLALCACLALLWDFGRRMRGSAWDGIWTAAFFVSAYEPCGRWLDLGRVDGLQIALLLGVAWLLRHGRSSRSAIAAGLVLAVAYACKQTSLVIVGPTLGWILFREFGRGVRVAIAFAIPSLIAHLWLEHVSGGWYGFYVYEVPAAHPWYPGNWLGFWTNDILRGLPVIFALALIGAWLSARGGSSPEAPKQESRKLHPLLWLLGALAASWMSRLHWGGFTNVTLPLWAFAALAASPALQLLPRPRQGAKLRQVSWLVFLLLAAQLTWQAPRPWAAIPPAAHAERWQKQVEALAELEGPILLPDHGALLCAAGHEPSIHTVAIWDLLLTLPEFQSLLLQRKIPSPSTPTRVQQVSRRFLTEARAAIARGDFEHLVLDAEDLQLKIPGSDWKQHYALVALLLPDAPAESGFAGSGDSPAGPRLIYRFKRD